MTEGTRPTALDSVARDYEIYRMTNANARPPFYATQAAAGLDVSRALRR